MRQGTMFLEQPITPHGEVFKKLNQSSATETNPSHVKEIQGLHITVMILKSKFCLNYNRKCLWMVDIEILCKVHG